MPPNYSLFSIPLYLFLTMVPHVYSVIFLARYKRMWDTACPRGTKFSQNISKSLPPQALAQYERARGAHNNMYENMAFFVGAVLAGAMMRVDAEFMNRWLAVYLVTRILYLGSYIVTENPKLAHARSVIFTGGLVVLAAIYVKAAQILVAERS